MGFRQLFDSDSSTFSYLLWDEASRDAVIIDSVDGQVERDIRLIEELGLHLRYALETHLHADHVTGASRLREYFGCQVAVHERAGIDCADRLLQEGDKIEFGSRQLKVLYTPGHTDNDVCFLAEDRVFTGDILLIRGSGRTDFQSGDPGRSYDSIYQKLFSLPGEILVYPAHDYAGHCCSSIDEERCFNPRLKVGTSREQYVTLMNGLALDPPARIDQALPANQACGRERVMGGQQGG